ncbi:restriction endonuclease subunit S [Yersinia pseudotuberculosis]|uniref:restriction endonuclease subunit S n=1 Tax=Yersinia pseudotuberculosis TaxID=633 RepID=UPI001A9D4BE6|nr:restriction endonuclease subunit S [Yersinia pseudotuberculosis]MBO1632287.1 restriction endonuclease subunit S [Yersinia pseudotuberculosis]MBP0069820.1 restriction endonuclease subunit S [Yersinia pseudotuberculosis]
MTKQIDGKAPNIRIRSFEGDWEETNLKDICELFTDGDWIESKDQSSEGIRLIQTGNIGLNQFIDKKERAKWVSLSTFQELKCKEVLSGDILISRLPEPAGRACIIPPKNYRMITVVDCTIVRVAEHCDNRFLVQHLSLRSYFNKINNLLAGGTRQRISRGNLAGFIIKLPSLSEQQKIGTYFYKLDEIIAQHQHKHKKLLTLKQAMLQKMFPQGGATVPKIRFKGFSSDWEEKKLEDIVELCSGRDYKQLSSGNIPVYGTGGYMLSVNKALSYEKDAIGIGRKGTIDKPYLLRCPFWTVDTLFYAIAREDFDLDFTYCIFQKIDWKKKDESTGVPSLSKSTINGIQVIVPPKAEQQKIGTYFRKLDELIFKHVTQLEKLKQIKSACLEKMFV